MFFDSGLFTALSVAGPAVFATAAVVIGIARRRANSDTVSLKFRGRDGSQISFRNVPADSAKLFTELKAITAELEQLRLRAARYVFDELDLINTVIYFERVDQDNFQDDEDESDDDTNQPEQYVGQRIEIIKPLDSLDTSRVDTIIKTTEPEEVFNHPINFETEEEREERALAKFRSEVCDYYRKQKSGAILIVRDQDNPQRLFDLRYRVPSRKFEDAFNRLDSCVLKYSELTEKIRLRAPDEGDDIIPALDEAISEVCSGVHEALPIIAEEAERRGGVLFHKYVLEEYNLYKQLLSSDKHPREVVMQTVKYKRVHIDSDKLKDLADVPQELACIMLAYSAHRSCLFTVKVDTKARIILRPRK